MASGTGLLLRLDADSRGMQQGVRKGADSLGGLEGQTSRTSKALAVAKTAATAFIASIGVREIARAVQATIDHAEAVDQLSQRYGVATERIGAWQSMAAKAGVEQNALSMGLQRLAKFAQDDPTKGLPAALDALGIGFSDASGAMRDSSEVMLDVADLFATTEDGATKTALAAQLFGEEMGPRLIPLLNAGREGMEAYEQQAIALNRTVDAEFGKAASAFNASLAEMKQAMTGYIRTAAQAWLPTLQRVVDKALEAANSLAGLTDVGAGEAAATARVRERAAAYDEVLDALMAVQEAEANSTARFGDSVETASAKTRASGLLEAMGLGGLSDDIEAQYEELLTRRERILQSITATAPDKERGDDLQGVLDKLKEEEADRKTAGAAASGQLAVDREREAAARRLAQLRAQVAGVGLTEVQQRTMALRHEEALLLAAYHESILTLDEYDDRLAVVREHYRKMGEEGADTITKTATTTASALDLVTERVQAAQSGIEGVLGLGGQLFDILGDGANDAGKKVFDLTVQVVRFGAQLIAQIASTTAAGVTAAATQASSQVAANTAIATSGAVAGGAQATATYGASAGVGAAAFSAAIGAIMGTVGIVKGAIGDAGLTPDAINRASRGGYTALIAERGEMLLDRTGTREITSYIAEMRQREARPQTGPATSITIDAPIMLDGYQVGRFVDSHMINSHETGTGWATRARLPA